MILPGLNSVFEKFIQAAVHLKKEHQQQKFNPTPKNHMNRVSSSTPKRNKLIQPKHAIPPPPPSVEDVEEQMRKWLLKHKFDEGFKIENTKSETTFEYTCLSCCWKTWKTHIVINKNGKAVLSNAQRHYTSNRCQKSKKKLRESSSFKVLIYFVKETKKARKKNIPTGHIDFQQEPGSSEKHVVQCSIVSTEVSTKEIESISIDEETRKMISLQKTCFRLLAVSTIQRSAGVNEISSDLQKNNGLLRHSNFFRYC